MSAGAPESSIQEAIWNGSLPLEIRLAPSDSRIYDQADPFFTQHPRLSYLPVLLPKLHAFFSTFLIDDSVIPYDGWFSFEGVPLKWQYPLGLLHDLFSGGLPFHSDDHGAKGTGQRAGEESSTRQVPWSLTVHFTQWPEEALVRPDAEAKVLHDAFINSVKEADFLRNGTAKGIMSLSKEDSTALWNAVQEHDRTSFIPIYKKLLYAQGAPLRHVPIKIYLPSTPGSDKVSFGHLKVVQSLITPHMAASREPRILGTVLHDLLPSLFPSRRTPVMARPVLHGVVVPMSAPMENLMRTAAYLDGWLHIGLSIID